MPLVASASPDSGPAAPNPQSAIHNPQSEPPLQYAVLYRLDARAGTGTGSPALHVGGLEAEFLGSYGRKWEFAGQVPLGSQLSSPGRRMHFGTLFLVRKWRIGEPTVKLGQFVVPFSNLTSYDVHSRLIQSLYRYSLGVRIDPGVAAEGYFAGDAEWQIAVTTGSGPYRWDRDRTPLATGRVSRRFEQGGNAVRLGLSAAGGTLPLFSLSGDPVSPDGSPLLGWVSKRRLALDAEIERGMDLFRLEGVAGTDDGRSAGGFWLGWMRPLNDRHTLEAAVEHWQQPERDGQLWGAWLGFERRLDGARVIRSALRWSRSREAGNTETDLSLAAQYVRQF